MSIPYAEVIGDPIAHSKSPLIHKFWLEKLGVEGDYRAKRVTVGELPGYLVSRRTDPDWRGCNVTMPFKQAVIPFLDEVIDNGIGAVNCIVPDRERLTGSNTDSSGFLAALRSASALDDPVPATHVATYLHLIGAGGAARAVAAAWRGGDIQYFNRTASKAEALADQFGPGSDYGYGCGLDPLQGGSLRDDDQRYNYIVVNASAMGMAGKPPVPIALDDYPNDTIVCDLVYDPVETPLLREARRLGFRVVDGLTVLVAQASYAFLFFFGMKPPREYDAELRELLTR